MNARKRLKPCLELLEERLAPTVTLDFGDAPDPTVGIGPGNYQTTAADNGPSHIVNPSLFLGAAIDSEADAQPNAAANGDDTAGALPDDEDGVFDAADLFITQGTAPAVRLRATNTTGSAATLFGWIDFNNNGQFDNAFERAQAAVADGANNGIFTLTFGQVPAGFAGTTYARFRLSTDAAAANATGPAGDGEVEDYRVEIVEPGSGIVRAFQKISDTDGNFTATFDDIDGFGTAVASLGDLDQDGVTDLAVGAYRDDDGASGGDRGAVYVLFMKSDGTVKSFQKISDTEGNFTATLDDQDLFGVSLANLGDVDGDGVTDLAVGVERDRDGSTPDADFGNGAVYILFLNTNGTVKSFQKISDTEGNFTATIDDDDLFGESVAGLGDVNGDGVPDLAVGALRDDDGGTDRGAVYILFLNTNGTVKGFQKISNTEGNFNAALEDKDEIGVSVAGLGDIDGDGVSDLAVGSIFDDDGGANRGAVYVLFLQADGTVKDFQKISDTEGSFTAILKDGERFGAGLANLGDVDGDGVTDLGVGAVFNNDGGTERGAMYVLFLNTNGTVKGFRKISDIEGNFTATLDNGDIFGAAVTSLGDVDGDGVGDIAVGANFDGDGGLQRGAAYVLFMGQFDYGDAPDPVTTDPGQYPTVRANNGARHLIIDTIHLGTEIDGEPDGQPDFGAVGDDSTGNSPGDEDAIDNSFDLVLVEGRTPRIRLRATNETGTNATLFGWIDYNGDGMFDNTTERAQANVANGANDLTVTLEFPVVPAGTKGKTFARFRLSTDPAAENPNGTAADGEVEDYCVNITDLTVDFYVDSKGLYENHLGGNEKWLRSDVNQSGNSWYYILPNGDIFEWDGPGLNGVFLNNLGANGWENPELLVNATPHAPLNPAELTAADETRAFYRSSTGNFWFDLYGGQEKWTKGKVSEKSAANQNNPWYFLLPNGAVHEWDGTPGQLTGTPLAGISADAAVYKDPFLLYDAFQDATVNSGGFDQLRNFYFASSAGSARDLMEGYDLNVDAKWFLGDDHKWYFVNPVGRLFIWDGTPFSATGAELADLGPNAWNNINRVVEGFRPALDQTQTNKLVALDAEHSLFRASNDFDFYFDFFGQKEKWLIGKEHQANNPFYLILSNRTLLEWDGTNSATGKILATNLPQEVYDNPLLLADAFADGSLLNNLDQLNPFQTIGGLSAV